MKSEMLEEITKSMQDKLGAENSALIADDLGKLITANTQTLDNINKMNAKIETLTSTNEKLVIANGNLLQQVPMDNELKHPKKSDPEEPKKSFSFKDCFDSSGNFKK